MKLKLTYWSMAKYIWCGWFNLLVSSAVVNGVTVFVTCRQIGWLKICSIFKARWWKAISHKYHGLTYYINLFTTKRQNRTQPNYSTDVMNVQLSILFTFTQCSTLHACALRFLRYRWCLIYRQEAAAETMTQTADQALATAEEAWALAEEVASSSSSVDSGISTMMSR